MNEINNLILDRYNPVSVAGEGGYGKVIVAWDTRIRRYVAIKCIKLRSNYSDSEGNTINVDQVTNRLYENNESEATTKINPHNQTLKNNQNSFSTNPINWQEDLPGLAEARTAAMIQDSNIVTVYDFELQNSTAYIIMEYVEGYTLTQFLSSFKNDITLDMITFIFNEVSKAISAAHKQGVLHLDIKPDNILIDKQGNVKVTDFGLATLSDEFGYGRANAGTIGYIPPEQIRQQNLDVRCDEWALASITYEMLTGTNPFFTNSFTSSLNAIYDNTIVPPSRYWQDLSPLLDDVLFKALSPDARNRYITVNEFRDFLTPFMGRPKAGKRQISQLLKQNANTMPMPNEPKNYTQPKEKSKLFDFKFSNWAKHIISRVFVCVVACYFIWLSSYNLNALSNTFHDPNIYLYVLGIIAVGSLIYPAAGVFLTYLFLALTYFLKESYICSVLLFVCSTIWLILTIRSSKNNNIDSCVSITYPLFNYYGWALSLPVLTGVLLKPKNAFISVVLGSMLCIVVPAIESNVVLMPYIWIRFLAWILPAVITSLIFQARKRWLNIFSCILSAILLTAGLCLSNYFNPNMVFWTPQVIEIITILFSCGACFIVAYFLPIRKI